MTTSISPIPAEPIGYARVEPKSPTRIWAGIVILLGGLALLVIGGCFLIGVMIMLSNGGFGNAQQFVWASSSGFFVVVLYILAGASFVFGVWVFIIGMRGLLRVLNAQ